MSEAFDAEEVYDNEIAPLMDQIIEICKRARMPMVASFCYLRDEDGEEGICTTRLPGGRPSEVLDRAGAMIQRGGSQLASFIITTSSAEEGSS